MPCLEQNTIRSEAVSIKWVNIIVRKLHCCMHADCALAQTRLRWCNWSLMVPGSRVRQGSLPASFDSPSTDRQLCTTHWGLDVFVWLIKLSIVQAAFLFLVVSWQLCDCLTGCFCCVSQLLAVDRSWFHLGVCWTCVCYNMCMHHFCIFFSVFILSLAITWWCYCQGNGLATHRSWVRVLAGHHCLGQAIYTCMPLSPSSIVWYRPRGWSLWLGK